MDNQDIHVKEISIDEDIHDEIKSFLEGLFEYSNTIDTVKITDTNMKIDSFED